MTGPYQPAGAGRTSRRTNRVTLPALRSPGISTPSPSCAPESLARTFGSSSHPRAPATAPERSGPPARGRLSDEGLGRLSRTLSSRDTAVLESVSTYRFLTTTQLRDFHFHGHANQAVAGRVCRRVLLRLRGLDVIEDLERRIGGVRAGSDAYVWRVGRNGDRLLRLARGDGARARRKEPSPRFLAHCLDIASSHLVLLAAARRGELELLRTDPEPTSWRPYLGPGGERLTLKPDLLVATAAGDFEDSWAFEIDEATESIPTLLRKCAQYEAYRATGREQADHGVFPLVVWIVPNQHRADRLDNALSRSQTLDRTLYRVCTPDRLLDVIRGGAQ